MPIDYNSTYDDESVQHSNERHGSDGGSFESGMESKAIPGMTVIISDVFLIISELFKVYFITVNTTIVMDDRPGPVMDNNGTTFVCEETQIPLNFNVTYGHELHTNGETSYISYPTTFMLF